MHLKLCNYGCTYGLRRVFQCIILHIYLNFIVIFVLMITVCVNGKDGV